MTATAQLPTATKRHFAFVDGLRGIAALAVVFYHVGFAGSRAARVRDQMPAFVRDPIVERGGLRVAVFFVLSGFVMAHILRKARITPSYTVRFIGRRLARLAPPYYASLFVAIAVAAMATVVKTQPFLLEDQRLTASRLLSHIPFLQEALHEPEIVSVYWTLCYEVAFYITFCVLMGIAGFLDRRWGGLRGRLVTFGLVGSMSLVLSLGHIQGEMRPVSWVRAFFAFLLGVFAYWTVQRILPIWALCLFAGGVLLSGLGADPDFRCVAVGTAALLVVAARRNKMGTWLSGRTAQFFGRTSYSLYLFHSAVLTVVYYATTSILGDGTGAQFVYVVLGVVACVGVAAVMWQLVERPSIALSRRVKLPSP